MTLKIYISIVNNGDGSASTVFFYDEDCAFLHQRLQFEGFAEDCVSELVINLTSDSPVEVEDVMIREEFIAELEEELEDDWTTDQRKIQLQNAIALLKGAI